MPLSISFLARTRWRDPVIFLIYAVSITLLIQFTLYENLKFDFTRITLTIVFLGQFYVASFLNIPIHSRNARHIALGVIFITIYFIFRELVIALSPSEVVGSKFFETVLVLFFGLTVLGRNIRMYMVLLENMERLNRLRLKNQLFSKPESVVINFGNEGKLTVHPNEIVYIRTKQAGDHTKIFGIKKQGTKDKPEKLVEYDTLAYPNFESIFKDLKYFPQFKRISQSTVFNFKYPYEEKSGVIIVEGRRFSMSEKFKLPAKSS